LAVNLPADDREKMQTKITMAARNRALCVHGSVKVDTVLGADARVGAEPDYGNLVSRARVLLMNIIGFAELLLLKANACGNREAAEYLSLIRNAGLDLKELLGEVFFDTEQVPAPGTRSIEAAEAVSRCREIVAARATVAGVSLETEVAPEAADVPVKEILVVEVLAGLLLFLVRKTPRGGKVGLRLNRLKDRILFVVWRNFAPGWQMASANNAPAKESAEAKRVFALVRELCKKEDGTFWMESTLGEMVSFCLALPPAVDEGANVEAKAAAGYQSKG